MLFKEEEKKKNTGLFSVDNLTNNKGLLSIDAKNKQTMKTETKPRTVLRTRLQQKQKIIIYKDEDKYYVDHAASFSLFLTKIRTIMLEKTNAQQKPKLIEINSAILKKLEDDESIEIEFKNITNNKPKMKVYVDDSQFCIDIAAAYSLNLINDEEFYYGNDKYYYINDSILTFLKANYDVEMYSLKLKEITEERTKK